ncbi:hypothetical protein LCGC14_1641360 [marine sediment metagenome]|uniref:Uncharacterized protein n=1 Tax=marine sediment metagenome TaxID=412755 RepID=A0A0F9I053_9ZZZZ
MSTKSVTQSREIKNGGDSKLVVNAQLLAALEALDTEYTRLCVATMDYASNRPEIVQQARDAIEEAKK